MEVFPKVHSGCSTLLLVHLPAFLWWCVVQAVFKMRNVLPQVKLGLSETSAKLRSFLKPTGWNSAGGFAGKVHCELCFLMTPSQVGANSCFFLAGVYALELQRRRRRMRMRIWARREGREGAGEPGPGAGCWAVSAGSPAEGGTVWQVGCSLQWHR